MTATTRFHQMEAEDVACARVLRFANGAVGWLTASTASFPGGAESIVMHFEAASLRLAEGILTVQWRDGRTETQGAQAGTGGGADPMAFTHDWHQAVIEDFARCAATPAAPPLASGRSALAAHAVIDAITQSARRGHPMPSGAPMTDPFRRPWPIDHRHIYGMAQNMIDAGAEFAAWWTEGDARHAGRVRQTVSGKCGPIADKSEDLLDDPTIDLVLIAAIPRDRAGLAIEAMEAGKHVMVDKPGCTTFEQLDAAPAASAAKRGACGSVDFSERFEVPAVTRASELVAAGEIGRVVQTVGLGPHRLNRPTRPDWFFDRAAYGGILVDIASHQIDQFLHFTGATEAEITMASVGNFANPGDPGLQDFGEIAAERA